MGTTGYACRLEALMREGFELVPRLHGDQPMVFHEADGGVVAVLSDESGRLWTWSTREGLVCEE